MLRLSTLISPYFFSYQNIHLYEFLCGYVFFIEMKEDEAYFLILNFHKSLTINYMNFYKLYCKKYILWLILPVEEQKGLVNVWLRRCGSLNYYDLYDLYDLTRFPYFYFRSIIKKIIT